jgi:hypothetical protein
MQVNICKGGLTDFEDSYIRESFRFQTDNIKCFVKVGLTLSGLIGIKICFPQEVPVEKTEMIDADSQEIV